MFRYIAAAMMAIFSFRAAAQSNTAPAESAASSASAVAPVTAVVPAIGVEPVKTNLLEIKYDQFEDYTTVSTPEYICIRENAVDWSLDLKYRLSTNFKGEGPTNKKKYYAINFNSTSKDWTFLSSHSLNCIVDGSRVSLGSGAHDGSVGEGYVSEFMVYKLTREFLIRLADSTDAKCQLLTTRFIIDDGTKTAIKQLLDFTELEQKPQGGRPIHRHRSHSR